MMKTLNVPQYIFNKFSNSIFTKQRLTFTRRNNLLLIILSPVYLVNFQSWFSQKNWTFLREKMSEENFPARCFSHFREKVEKFENFILEKIFSLFFSTYFFMYCRVILSSVLCNRILCISKSPRVTKYYPEWSSGSHFYGNWDFC